MKEGCTMKKLFPKALLVCMTVLLLTALCFTALAADETNYAVYGDGIASSTFFVHSYGNARVILTQQSGTSSVNQYEKEVFGKYHIYVTAPNGSGYTEDWNQSLAGAIHQMNFPDIGVYKVTVTPFTEYEMRQTTPNGQFNRWTSEPYWWLFAQTNCTVQEQLKADICVLRREASTNKLISVETLSLPYGTTDVTAGEDPQGYSLLYPTEPTQVIVYQNGTPSQSVVEFFYKGALTPVERPPVSNNSGKTKVAPTDWDTRFKPGTCTTSNISCVDKLNYLHDNKASTVFSFTLWNSEWKDGTAQFTAFFNNETISSIGLVNGDVSSEQKYEENARVRNMRVVVSTASGIKEYNFSVNDFYYNKYQIFTFDKPLDKVFSIDIFIEAAQLGTKNKYNICISDMCFYK